MGDNIIRDYDAVLNEKYGRLETPQREVFRAEAIEFNSKNELPNETTIKAIKDAANGDTIKCGDFFSYLKQAENLDID